MSVSQRVGAAASKQHHWGRIVAAVLALPHPPPVELDFRAALRELLTADSESLVSAPVFATSTDQADQGIDKTLDARETSFWSSAGTQQAGTDDSVVYQLSGPMALVREVRVSFFEADFQDGNPLYPSQALRVDVGWLPPGMELDSCCKRGRNIPGEDPGPDLHELADQFVWDTAQLYPGVANTDACQAFRLPKLALGAFIRLKLIGKLQTQSSDGLYYVCIKSLRVVGIPFAQLQPNSAQLCTEVASAKPSFLPYLQRIVRTDEPLSPAVLQVAVLVNRGVIPESLGEDSPLELVRYKLAVCRDWLMRKYGAQYQGSGAERDADFRRYHTLLQQYQRLMGH
eukprot:TRINITY_DN39481_c0_g1_i1.p1 TRINITY_DN39481_c0_g1~~TRINITY_DN39481_c0_g1_i1.p1  ORF type:complete len:386 (+),score=63.84 TRINITY_DN39481_c0_g1_i1:135-1160(+)